MNPIRRLAVSAILLTATPVAPFVASALAQNYPKVIDCRAVKAALRRDLLNAQPGDQVDDLFPGTGAIQAAISDRLRELPAPLTLFGEPGDAVE